MKELINDREALEKFSLELYEYIANKLPKYKDLLSPEKLKERLDNPQKLEEYKKSLEALKKDKQSHDNYLKIDKEYNGKVPISINFYRVVEASVVGGDFEETKETNTKYVEAKYSVSKAQPFIKEALNKMLNTELNVKFNNLYDLSKKFIEDPQSAKLGFVVQHCIDGSEFYKVENKVFKEFIDINQGLMQYSSTYQNACALTGNILNYILPEGLKNEELLSIIRESEDIFTKYKDYEEIKSSNPLIPTEAFQQYVFKSLAYEGDIKQQESFNNFLEQYGIKNSKDLMFNYYFVDDKGNKINTADVVSNKNTNATIKEYTKEEKEEILKGLERPFVYHLYEDKELMEKMAKDMFSELAKTFPESKDILTEEKAIEEVNDEEKLEMHKLALGIKEKQDKLKQLGEQLEKELNVHVDKSLQRNFSLYLDLSNTEEAKQKNIDFIKKISTKQGAIDFVTSELKVMREIDWNSFKDMSEIEILKNYDKVTENTRSAYVINSIIQDGGFSKTSQFNEYLKSNLSTFELLQFRQQIVDTCALPFYPIIPKNLILSPNKLIEFTKILCDVKDKYKDSPIIEHSNTPVGKLGFSEMMKYNTIIVPYQEEKKDYNKVIDLINQKVLDPKMFKNNYYLDNENNKVTSAIIFNENSQFKVCKYTEEQNKTIDKVLENPLSDKKLDYLEHILDKKTALQDFMQELRNAKAIFSFRNSTEYNDLVDACNRLDEAFNNAPEDLSTTPHEIEIQSIKDLNKALADVDKAAKDYIEAKKDKSRNSTRQLRFEIAHSIVNIINKEELDAKFEQTNDGKDIPTGALFDKPKMVEGIGYPLDEHELNQLDIDVNGINKEESVEEGLDNSNQKIIDEKKEIIELE